MPKAKKKKPEVFERSNLEVLVAAAAEAVPTSPKKKLKEPAEEAIDRLLAPLPFGGTASGVRHGCHLFQRRRHRDRRRRHHRRTTAAPPPHHRRTAVGLVWGPFFSSVEVDFWTAFACFLSA